METRLRKQLYAILLYLLTQSPCFVRQRSKVYGLPVERAIMATSDGSPRITQLGVSKGITNISADDLREPRDISGLPQNRVDQLPYPTSAICSQLRRPLDRSGIVRQTDTSASLGALGKNELTNRLNLNSSALWQAPLSLETKDASQVYSNLIILEESFRTQFLELQKSRRSLIIFFWLILACSFYLTYSLWFNPSVYKGIFLLQSVCTLACYIALGLFYLSGMYTKVFVTAPRFINDANRGLRDLNFKLVKSPRTWNESLHHIVRPTYMQHPGRLLQIVLSPRAFPSFFIEGWETYRMEFWEREERHRAARKLKQDMRSHLPKTNHHHRRKLKVDSEKKAINAN